MDYHIMELTWWWGLTARNITDSEAIELAEILKNRLS